MAQGDLWFAQTLGLRFNEPDFWAILEDWPKSLFVYWKARYLMEPWDFAGRQALANSMGKQIVHAPPKFDEPPVPDTRKRVFRKQA